MSSLDIYALALPKVKNAHYFSRYIKFILGCIEKNKTRELKFFDKHHILPKACELFPEYKNFNLYPWNCVKLTFREHIIAHVMLWKIFGGSQIGSLMLLLNETPQWKANRKVPSSLLIRYYDTIKTEHRESMFGKCFYFDDEKNCYQLRPDDPLISELNLVHVNSGSNHYNNGKIEKKFMEDPGGDWVLGRLYTFTDKGLDNLSRRFVNSKFWNDGIRNYNIPANQTPEPHWIPGRIYDEVTIEAIRKNNTKLFTGSKMYNDGIKTYKIRDNEIPDQNWILGRVKNDFISENIRRNNKENFTGKKMYNNGIIQKMFKENPGDGWIPGRLSPINVSEENLKSMKEKLIGSKRYNDGVMNYTVLVGQEPESHWVPGIIRKKK